jgi:hypothetical protein
MVERRAEFGDVQRMPWAEQDVDRRDQQDALGYRALAPSR